MLRSIFTKNTAILLLALLSFVLFWTAYAIHITTGGLPNETLLAIPIGLVFACAEWISYPQVWVTILVVWSVRKICDIKGKQQEKQPAPVVANLNDITMPSNRTTVNCLGCNKGSQDALNENRRRMGLPPLE